MTQNSNLDQKRQIEIQQIQGLLKRQNDLLGQSLMNLDQILFLQKSISRLNLKDISEVLVEKLPYILSIRYFTLFLYDKNKRLLTLACNNHPGIEDGKEVALKDSGVMQDALTQGRYILEPDFTKSKYFAGKRNPLFKDPFMVCIPLMIENEIIGVMNLNDNDRGYFSVGDLDFVLNVMEFISLSISNALLYQKTELLSVTDGLTLLHNHQHMQKILQSEFARCKRYQSTLSVVMMDVDHFKNINDTYGHQVGDEVLVEMAQVISRFCRANDAAARYGGEEFILILPETALEGARQIAERIRGEIENKTFGSNGNSFKVTLSCGVVEQDPERINSPAKLVQVADRALYRAKEGGRNQTQVGSG